MPNTSQQFLESFFFVYMYPRKISQLMLTSGLSLLYWRPYICCKNIRSPIPLVVINALPYAPSLRHPTDKLEMRRLAGKKKYTSLPPTKIDTVKVRSTDTVPNILGCLPGYPNTVTMKTTGLTQIYFDAYRVRSTQSECEVMFQA